MALLLDRARAVRVLVVGDLMLDVYLRGGASRISPEAPVPVVQVLEEWRALGGAGNVAANAVALGASCELVGCVGQDPAGQQLHDELEAQGIDTRGVLPVADRPTTVKTRVLVRHQQVARYDRERDAEVDPATAATLAARVDQVAAACDVIVLEDYNKGVLVPVVIEAALDAGRRLGKPVVVDPKAQHFFGYAGATVFKPNLSELAAALQAPVLAGDAEWMERARRRLDCANLLVTLGEDGMALRTEAGELHHLPTAARSVYDVSGAGDTVTATLAVVLAAGGSVLEAAYLANLAAGLEVAKAGVATVSAAELLEELAVAAG
jgi:rfaE bifunctional protein kinase chain/domain